MTPTRNATDEVAGALGSSEHGGCERPFSGRFVVSQPGWEQAAGVTLFLGRAAPAGRVEGGIDPSMVFFDNPVDRLRTRNDFERSLEGSRRGCGPICSR